MLGGAARHGRCFVESGARIWYGGGPQMWCAESGAVVVREFGAVNLVRWWCADLEIEFGAQNLVRWVVMPKIWCETSALGGQ